MSRDLAARRAFAFIDASDTQAGAARAFGDPFANFNPLALAEEVSAAQGWTLAGIAYYVGVPDAAAAEGEHQAWIRRCERWRKQGVRVFTRTLLPDEAGVAREKGIELRMALDAVSLFRDNAYDVALLFSRDQDFSELAAELKALARAGKRTVEVASAFAGSQDAAPRAGVSGTLPIPLDEGFFRRVMDTPENRRRVHAPILAPAPRAGRAAAAAAMPRRVGTTAMAERRPRSLRRAAGVLLSLYAAIAGVTFGYLTWTGRAELTSPETALPELADHAVSAVTWPARIASGDPAR